MHTLLFTVWKGSSLSADVMLSLPPIQVNQYALDQRTLLIDWYGTTRVSPKPP